MTGRFEGVGGREETEETSDILDTRRRRRVGLTNDQVAINIP